MVIAFFFIFCRELLHYSSTTRQRTRIVPEAAKAQTTQAEASPFPWLHFLPLMYLDQKDNLVFQKLGLIDHRGNKVWKRQVLGQVGVTL